MTGTAKKSLQLILFDLDGTLVDTAPDLGGTVNRMRLADGLSSLPIESYRPSVSHGAKGLLEFGYGLTPEHANYGAYLNRFLDDYERHICHESVLFPGIADLLALIENTGHQWGVVTNKRTRFTLPLMDALGLTQRASCIVCADTTAAPKPSPLPMLYALERSGCIAQQTIYIGDDERDVLAGRAAAMETAAITYGYHSLDSHPASWGADKLFNRPADISHYLKDLWVAGS